MCYGTDLNRNFEYMWMYAGASNNSCTQTYAGPEPFSEPETRALRDWVLANNEHAKLYLAFHSYGEMMLFPWGYEFLIFYSVWFSYMTLCRYYTTFSKKQI